MNYKITAQIITLALVLFLGSCVGIAQRRLAERYYNIAADYYNDKNYKRAVEYYALALKEDPNFKIIFLNYGMALIETGDYAQAERQLLRAHALDRRNTLCLSALGYLNFRAKKYEDAANWYRQVITINPYNPQTFYNLGVIAQYVGNYKASQQAFDKVAELQDSKAQPKEMRRFAAKNQLHLGDEEKAMELYREYLTHGGAGDKSALVFQDIYDFYSQTDKAEKDKTQKYNKIIQAFRMLDEAKSPLAAFLLAELYYLKLQNPVLGLENLKNAINRGFDQKEPDKIRLKDFITKKLKGRDRKTAEKLLNKKKEPAPAK